LFFQGEAHIDDYRTAENRGKTKLLFTPFFVVIVVVVVVVVVVIIVLLTSPDSGGRYLVFSAAAHARK